MPRPRERDIVPCERRLSYLKSFLMAVSIVALNVFITKMVLEYSDGMLSQKKHQVTGEIKHHIDELKSSIVDQVFAKLLPTLKDATEKLQKDYSKLKTVEKGKGNGNDSLRNLVQEEIQKYDEDKTGKTDFALAASGGSIVSTRDTEMYNPASTGVYLFGFALCETKNKPETILRIGNQVGECWSFKGSKGRVVIQLLGTVAVKAVTLEHISKRISPTQEISSAPKEFSIWGLPSVDSDDGFFLGKFVYEADGPTVQSFELVSEENGSSNKFSLIEFEVHSNHGNPHYTCVYRVRVHGKLETRTGKKKNL